MNLLIDDWLPVRSLYGGTMTWIGLSKLMTTEDEYEICLPRDDLEMAALQLVICIVQVLFPPADMPQLVKNLRNPITEQDYLDGIKNYKNWFSVDHPEHPFMQVRGVKAIKKTPMQRLLPGLADATNSCFVNEANISKSLCGGCSVIAIFNRATNAPSFGGGAQGGFKPGLRGSIPITTLVQGRHLRETIWLNVLSQEYANSSTCNKTAEPTPTWVAPIKEKSSFSAASIGLLRGLFWQPALIELGHSVIGACSLCGRQNIDIYSYFFTNQFGYTINGTWPHPHSPKIFSFKKMAQEEKYASFTTPAPTWTRLSSFVVQKEVNQSQKEGHQPSAVVLQARQLFSKRPDRLRLIIGGYRSNKASIFERRHELFDLNKGWHLQPRMIQEFVDLGISYKSALRKSLYVFYKGLKSIKGAGIPVQEIGETHFYHRTDSLMQKALAEAHFDDPERLSVDKDALRAELKKHTLAIFQEQTRPYLNDPELIRTMAVARWKLNKNLKELEPDIDGGDQ